MKGNMGRHAMDEKDLAIDIFILNGADMVHWL